MSRAILSVVRWLDLLAVAVVSLLFALAMAVPFSVLRVRERREELARIASSSRRAERLGVLRRSSPVVGRDALVGGSHPPPRNV